MELKGHAKCRMLPKGRSIGRPPLKMFTQYVFLDMALVHVNTVWCLLVNTKAEMEMGRGAGWVVFVDAEV